MVNKNLHLVSDLNFISNSVNLPNALDTRFIPSPVKSPINWIIPIIISSFGE